MESYFCLEDGITFPLVCVLLVIGGIHFNLSVLFVTALRSIQIITGLPFYNLVNSYPSETCATIG
jgi:hypothetical protein